MTLHFFACFHNKIFPEIYDISEEEKQNNITLYGVKNRASTDLNVVYENELKIYNPKLQQRTYNEGSCIYHVYMNNLHTKYDYVGFCQYDMMFQKNTLSNIKNVITTNPNTIFYVDFFQWAFLGGQTSIIRDYDDFTGGLKSYNNFFNTNYTENDLITNKMITCNTFLIPSKMYEKMMSWLKQYFINDINNKMLDKVNNITFDPGHMIEALTGMFLALEISQGSVYHKINLNHNHQYKHA